MAIYFFNLRNGEVLEKDLEGSEFATAEEAKAEAVLAARQLMAAKVFAGERINGQVFEITSEDGTIVENLPLRSVLLID